MASPMTTLDEINRHVWNSPTVVTGYEQLNGWTDPGEQAAVRYIAQEMRSQPILDMGVGAGRTTVLLQPISENYIGIDYTREMIETCQRRYPRTQYLHMDARDLSRFADNQFALVMFSYNGIDTVDISDRQQVLREVHRVLRPNGVFIVSAHNRNGPGCGERPALRLAFTPNPLKLGWRVLKSLGSLSRAVHNYRRLRALNEIHDDWAIMNCAAHDFRIVVVYTTLKEQKRQLAAAGFRTEIVFDSIDGEPVTDTTPTQDSWWFHYLARKVG